MRVLLIEDHKPLLRVLRQGLEEEGFAVDVAADGEEGDFKARTSEYDVIILDLMLPKVDGLTLLQQWRKNDIKTHVLVLTARGSIDDKVKGLDLGADDYLTKPFELNELIARLRALIRRRHEVKDPILRIHDLEVDTAARAVRRGGKTIHLTPREFALLEFLAFHRGKVVSRSMIWEHLYDEQDENTSNVVDVYIRYLRNKIDKGFEPSLILTRWGEGYLLRGEGDCMRSIRASLMVYFLGLLSLALVTASLLAYQTSYLTLQDKKTATEALIEKQYTESCKRDRDRLDRRLADQAEAIARLVKFHIELPAPREERQGPVFAWLMASTQGQSVAGSTTGIYLWCNLLPTRRDDGKSNGSKSELTKVEAGKPENPPRRDSRVSDPYGWVFRKREIKLSEDDLFEKMALVGGTAEYFQIDAVQLGSFQSEKLGKRSLSFDPATIQALHPEFDNVELTPDNLRLRRVVLYIPTGMGPTGPGGPPRGPGRQGPSAPDRGMSLDFTHSRPLYIQCATPTANLENRLQELKDTRDTELAKVEEDATESRRALRNRLIGMSLVTFAVITFGTWYLVRLGLSPLQRLSVAVSKVSAKDFRLQFDETRLPSELQPIRDRLVDTLEQLKRAFDREKQATADISHELRTPLAALLTTMELALRKTRTPDEYREMFQDCLLSGQHMNHVVERLLALARLDAGSDHLRPKQVDVSQLADQCVAMVRPLAEAKGLNLRVHHAAAVEATVDPAKLREMMINLLHNAIQYNRPNGSVTLVVGRSDSYLDVSVSDTGIGILAEKRAQIFERFYRADPSRGMDGAHAGLGLAIVKGYVDLMGGTLEVDSEVEQGSTFRIRLPLPA